MVEFLTIAMAQGENLVPQGIRRDTTEPPQSQQEQEEQADHRSWYCGL